MMATANEQYGCSEPANLQLLEVTVKGLGRGRNPPASRYWKGERQLKSRAVPFSIRRHSFFVTGERR